MKLEVGVTWSNLLSSHPDDATRLLEEERQLAGVSAARLQLKEQVEQVEQDMMRLKMEYDALLEESTLSEKRVRGQSLKQAATCVSQDQGGRSVEQNPSPRYQTTPAQALPPFPQSSSS